MKSRLIASLVVLLTFSACAAAARRTVWQIGTFDESPLEFSSEPRDHIDFEIGKSDVKKQWSSYQAVGHPYRVLFALDAAHGRYLLKIGALIVQPRVPALRVEINGQGGTFFLHPKLSYFPGDVESSYHPNNSQASVAIEIPPALLRAGPNIISLTCVNDPPDTPGEESSSGIAYDAISLEQDNGSSYGNTTVDVRPTILYRQVKGKLLETVDAFVRFSGSSPDGIAELQMQENRYQSKMPGVNDFGERRVSFEVPEWPGTIKGKLRVTGGRARTFGITLTAERKWTLFVVPHTHLDVGFTDYQGKVAETQSRVLSQAAELIHQHPDFRFSMDGAWNLQQLLETRPASKAEEILNLLRAGKMAMPAQYCNVLTGYASLETLYRSLYSAKALSREYGLPFEYANITDVPTYSGSYPSVLASSGVKYWAAAANNYRAPLLFHEKWNEKSPFWWEGPDGRKVLVWYSWAYLQVQTLFGLPPSLDAVRESLPIFLQAYSKPS